MRILQVTPYFSPQMGGAAQVVYQIAQHLGKRGHAVTVLSSDHGTRIAGFETDACRTILFAAISRWGFYFTPGIMTWVQKHIREFDVIHMHTVRTFQNAIVHHFAVRHGIPYVLSAHGTLPIIVQRRFAKRAYDFIVGRKLLASASQLIAVSPAEMDQYRVWGIENERIRTISNGLDLQEFRSLPPKGTFRRKLDDLSQDTKIILFLGRLHLRKGIDFLIRAFALVQATMPDSMLVVAGPDEGERGNLLLLTTQLGLQSRVYFTGALYGAAKLAAYVDADVLALPSRYEIFGLVPFEALMCGTPVIVSHDCGLGQIIGEARAGYVVPYGDIEALATTLRQVLENQQEATRTVKAGQAYIQSRLDWEAIVNEIEELYREITGL